MLCYMQLLGRFKTVLGCNVKRAYMYIERKGEERGASQSDTGLKLPSRVIFRSILALI